MLLAMSSRERRPPIDLVYAKHIRRANPGLEDAAPLGQRNARPLASNRSHRRIMSVACSPRGRIIAAQQTVHMRDCLSSRRRLIPGRGLAWAVPVVLGCALVGREGFAGERFEFTRLVAHWSEYAEPGYLSFVEEAKPEVVQVGFYGAHFWSLADTRYGSGYPAHLPVRGHRECAEWLRRLNTELHRRGAKVIGHMNVKFLVGDPDSAEGPRGFFRFYRAQWDEKLLGPKPVSDPMELLEKDRYGKPIADHNYNIGGMREYWACLNNPHWRQVLKAWIAFGIAQGVDGFIANYF